MASNRRRDTSPEMRLRRRLHACGLRYRVDYPIDILGRRPIRPDIVFPRLRVAVFVDGCFWHGCPEHGSVPKTNEGYWIPKLQRNRQRDRETDQALEQAGWTTLRIWEHVQVGDAAALVRQTLEQMAASHG